MADAKPFTDEELEEDEGLECDIVDLMACSESCHDWKQKRDIIIEEYIGRFRATIEEYKKALDSVMRQVSALNKGNIADCKRIEDYTAVIEKMKTAIHDCIERPKGVVPDSAVEFYDMRGLGINEKPHKATEDQAATIERLRGALERIACYGDKIANLRLEKLGSYGAFDEPGSVETARLALGERSE